MIQIIIYLFSQIHLLITSYSVSLLEFGKNSILLCLSFCFFCGTPCLFCKPFLFKPCCFFCRTSCLLCKPFLLKSCSLCRCFGFLLRTKCLLCRKQFLFHFFSCFSRLYAVSAKRAVLTVIYYRVSASRAVYQKCHSNYLLVTLILDTSFK